jgi:hypothetical protein
MVPAVKGIKGCPDGVQFIPLSESLYLTPQVTSSCTTEAFGHPVLALLKSHHIYIPPPLKSTIEYTPQNACHTHLLLQLSTNLLSHPGAPEAGLLLPTPAKLRARLSLTTRGSR